MITRCQITVSVVLQSLPTQHRAQPPGYHSTQDGSGRAQSAVPLPASLFTAIDMVSRQLSGCAEGLRDGHTQSALHGGDAPLSLFHGSVWNSFGQTLV